MTNRSQKPKTSPPATKTAKRAPAAKRFLMPQVDLGGLGGGDEDDDLPPLDLGRFDRPGTPEEPVVEDPVGPSVQTAGAVPAQQPTHEPSHPVEGDVAATSASAATPAAISVVDPALALTPDLPADQGPLEPKWPTAAATAFPGPVAGEEATITSTAVPSPAPAPDSSAVPAAQATATAPALNGAADVPTLASGPATAGDRPTAPAQEAQPTEPEPVSTAPSELTHPDVSVTNLPSSAATVPAVWDGGGHQAVRQWSPATSNSAVPARRPRRAPSRPFTSNESHQRRDDRLRELVEKAPRYAALLQSYAIAQSGKEIFQNRNVQLYGLTAQQLADRITVDKAVMTAVNLPTPRFTPAHYIDAVLDQALSGLDPQGTSIQNMEAERDIVWELAQDGLAYRDYITTDPEIAAMKKPRSQCPLRVKVNQRYSRMMDILRTMPDIKTQPFEIASACVAKYLEGLQAEQPAFEGFWDRNLVSTYE